MDTDRTPELLARYYDGDIAARDELLEQHTTLIKSEVHKRLNPNLRRLCDTQDVMQEVIIKVLQRGPRLKPDSAKMFRSWLITIVHNLVIDLVRRQLSEARDERRREAVATGEIEQVAGDGHGPPTQAQSQERGDLLRVALGLLDLQSRDVIELKQVQSLTYHEIGGRLGISEEAARKRYKRALPLLRSKYDQLRGTLSAITL